jgi:crotonobetainyl-CoA:carnitine CoA-transferase CaiB-like acyl-CoA transferase
MQALDGIRVLEFSRVLAGPWCGMTLADLGADVIKLEPLEGDDTRAFGPPFRDGISAYFACCNRNKRSLALDLRAPGVEPVLTALVQGADVLVQNFRTGADAGLGIDYPAVAALNPRLIYCSISGYGRTGPGCERAGYDFVVQAEAGLMAITGAREGEPSKVGVAVADIVTGQNAAIAILAALRAREQSGRGQFIDLSLFDSQLQALANVASSALFTGAEALRHGNAHASIVPYQTFRASDGAFAVAVASQKLWLAFCGALDRPHWSNDPRFADNAARVANRASLVAALSGLFAGASTKHWLDCLTRAGVPCAPIASVQQALDHPIAAARGMRIEIDGVRMVGSAIKLSDTPVAYRRPPPKLGQHSDEILRELGIDPAPLRAAGALR